MITRSFQIMNEVMEQSRDNHNTRLIFYIAFMMHYALKKLGIHLALFPKLRIKLEKAIFETRPKTVDFWCVWRGFEKEITNYLMKNTSEKGIFIDVGANIGRYSVLMAKKGWEVHSFEPIPSNYEQLLKNLRLNRLKNTKPYELAIGNENGNTKIFFEEHKAGEASIAIRGPNSKMKIIETRRLDDLFKKKFLQESILKIDVEGFEYEVLKGSIEFIKRNHPKIIIEIWKKNQEKVYDLLGTLGYEEKNEILSLRKHPGKVNDCFFVYHKNKNSKILR